MTRKSQSSFTKNPRGRRLLSQCIAAACGLLALAGSAREAAAGWTCSTVDGNGGGSGKINAPVVGVGAAASWLTLPFAFYTVNSGGDYFLRSGQTSSSPLYETIEGDSSLSGQTTNKGGLAGSASVYNNFMWVIHTDDSLNLRATRMDLFGTWTRSEIDGSGQGTFSNIDDYSASIVFDNKLFVFYTEVNSVASNNVLRVASFNGTSWSYQSPIDGDGGAADKITGDLQKPAAIVFDGVLRVYYYDFTNGNLREATSANGTTWSRSTIDGHSTSGGRVSANVGNGIAAVAGSKPFVFYYDQTNGNLRVASLSSGTWSFDIVDGVTGSNGQINGNLGANPTAVIHEGVPHLYYQNVDSWTIRAAWLTAPSTWNALTLDGAASGNLCSGAVNSALSGPKATVVNDNPRVYYTDETDHAVRFAQFN